MLMLPGIAGMSLLLMFVIFGIAEFIYRLFMQTKNINYKYSMITVNIINNTMKFKGKEKERINKFVKAKR